MLSRLLIFVEALWKQEGAKRCEYLASREKKPRRQGANKALKRCREANFCGVVRSQSKQNMSALVRTGS